MIDSRYLRSLMAKYAPPLKPENPDPTADLLRKYQVFRQTNLLDCAVLATALTAEDLMDGNGSRDPLIQKAIDMTSPNFDVDAFHGADEWIGLINTVKGKYFELLVVDKLNAGQQVGDVLLPDGFHAEVANSLTQPGWDMQIVDAEGRISSYLQLKASDSVGYIQEALSRYPDIQIIATSEVAGQVDDNHMVLDSGITEDQLHEAVQLAVDHHDNVLAAFWDNFHPLLPLLIITGMQGYQVMVGKATVRGAIEIGLARGSRSMVMALTAGTVKWLGGGWAAIPLAWAAGAWFTRMQSIDGLVDQLNRSARQLSCQARYYQTQFQR